MKRFGTALLALSLLTAAACDKKDDKDDKKDPGSDDATAAVAFDKEFTFSGETGESDGQLLPTLLPFKMDIPAKQAAVWEITITNSTCDLKASDVYPMLQTGEHEYTEFPGTVEKGVLEFAFMVGTSKACTFSGKAHLKPKTTGGRETGGGNTGGDEGGGDTGGTTGGDEGGGDTGGTTGGGDTGGDTGGEEIDPQTLPAITLGASESLNGTAADLGGGQFGFYKDYRLTLTQAVELGTSSSSYSSNCSFSEYDGPFFLMQSGPGEFEELPYDLEAGVYVIRALVTADRSCVINGSFTLEQY